MPERIARDVGIGIDVVGFDLGSGLPEPKDYQDIPNVRQTGFYRMDVDRLKGRLRQAELFPGEVGIEIEKFPADDERSPVGALIFDLNFNSSTLSSFQAFDLPSERILPRVFYDFDDIIHGPRLQVSISSPANVWRSTSISRRAISRNWQPTGHYSPPRRYRTNGIIRSSCTTDFRAPRFLAPGLQHLCRHSR